MKVWSSNEDSSAMIQGRDWTEAGNNTESKLGKKTFMKQGQKGDNSTKKHDEFTSRWWKLSNGKICFGETKII